jgi:very-short-patch-repair endonuclease
VVDRAGNDLLDMAFLPQAELWRINHGWRRAANRHGFVLDPTNGRWLARDRDGEDEEDPGPTSATPVTGLMPVVRDTRNLLLLRVLGREDADEAFLKTFAHAIRRAIQLVYQVEEQEVAVELIGQEDHQRIMLWEAAEGGIGIWDRLIESPLAIAELASQALKVTHIDPETGEEKQDDKAAGCTAACYDCLLSYANQPDHRFMDRSLILEYLMELRRPEFAPEPERRGYDEQYAWLLERVDPESSFERAFLDHLHDRQMRLPDRAQNRPSTDVAVQPDFYYERDGVPGICVFIDGPHHDAPKQAEDDRTKRASLEDAGFRVVAIRHDRTIGEQVEDHGDVF